MATTIAQTKRAIGFLRNVRATGATSQRSRRRTNKGIKAILSSLTHGGVSDCGGMTVLNYMTSIAEKT